MNTSRERLDLVLAVSRGDFPECYLGMYRCPKCDSEKTGTTTISTSRRWMWFVCHKCRWTFKRSSANTSPLSSHLRGLATLVGEIHEEV